MSPASNNETDIEKMEQSSSKFTCSSICQIQFNVTLSLDNPKPHIYVYTILLCHLKQDEKQ